MKHLLKFAIGLGSMFILVALLGWYLAPRDELQKAEAIVAISGGDTKARTLTAVNLYKEDWAPMVIVAGAAADPGSVSNAVVMRQIAVSEGVPSNAIRTEGQSRDTEENAEYVANTFETPPERIILVTSPYHQRRAFQQFSKAFPDTEIVNYPAYDQKWRRSLWWITPRGWYLTLSESFKLIYLNISEK